MIPHQQNSQDFLCQHFDHQGHQIIGFCLNQYCSNPSQFCLLCAQQIHTIHQKDCLAFQGIINLLSNSLKLMKEYEIKSRKLFECWEFCQKKFKQINSYRLIPFQNTAKNFVKKVLFLQNFAHKGQEYLELLIYNLKIENYQFIRNQIKNLKLINDLKIDFDKTIKLNKHIEKISKFCDFLQRNYPIFSKGQNNQSLNKLQIANNQTINSQGMNINVFMVQGNNLLILQNYVSAINCFENALQINPNSLEALGKKGDALFKLNKFKEALDCYDKLFKLNRSYQNCAMNRGQTLVELVRIDEAIYCFDQALEQDPSNYKAYFQKGIALEKQNKKSEALFCFQIANSINSEPQYLYKIINILFEQNNYEQSLEFLNKLLEVEYENPDALNLKGQCLMKLDRLIEAQQVFEKCVNINKEDHLAWMYQGQILASQKDFKKAIQCSDKGLKMSKSPPAWYYTQKGYYLSQMKLYTEAIICFNKGLEIDPKSEANLIHKGDALSKLQKIQDAQDCYDQALKINPQNKRAIQKQRNVAANEFLNLWGKAADLFFKAK